MILFFRGKAATGKSTVAEIISKQRNFKVVSKDSMFDALLIQGLDWSTANTLAYDKLAESIQVCHDRELDIIVDLGLAHTPYFTKFFNKMKLDFEKVRLFLFVCGNNEIWEERISKRVNSPEFPNQAFESISDATRHYDAYHIQKLSYEIEIDSALSIEAMVNKVYDVI